MKVLTNYVQFYLSSKQISTYNIRDALYTTSRQKSAYAIFGDMVDNNLFGETITIRNIADHSTKKGHHIKGMLVASHACISINDIVTGVVVRYRLNREIAISHTFEGQHLVLGRRQ